MTRLSKGDPCPCCGNPIKSDDPFELGYLSALHDVFGTPGTPDMALDGLKIEEGAIKAAAMPALARVWMIKRLEGVQTFSDYFCRFVAGGGKLLEEVDNGPRGDEND